jgi:hypothetical protein
MTEGNGYGSRPDETPRYGVRLPGGTPEATPGGTPGGQTGQPGPAPSGTGNQPSGWDQPREHQTFGPYVPDAAPRRGGYGAQGLPGPYGAPQRPTQVKAASIILWIAAGLYTVLTLVGLSFLSGTDLKSALLESTDTLPADQADLYRDTLDAYTGSMLSGILVFTGVMVVAIGILAAVAAWRTWKGSNPWRIAGTVCGAAMAAYQLFMMLIAPAMGLPGLAVCIIVIVLWFSKPASAWFRAKAAQRR